MLDIAALSAALFPFVISSFPFLRALTLNCGKSSGLCNGCVYRTQAQQHNHRKCLPGIVEMVPRGSGNIWGRWAVGEQDRETQQNTWDPEPGGQSRVTGKEHRRQADGRSGGHADDREARTRR